MASKKNPKKTTAELFGDAPNCVHLPPVAPTRMILAPTECAERAIGPLVKGCRIMGFTKGQFSLLDLIKAVIHQTGPVDLVISTWTTGIRDADNINMLSQKGDIRSLKLLTDWSFPNRRPKDTNAVKRAFGNDSIVVTTTHAKFAVLSNERWSIVIRSSMNLNRNPRFEQFDLDDSPELMAFVMEHVNDICRLSSPGLKYDYVNQAPAFVATMGGGISDVYKLTEGGLPQPPEWLDSAD